MNEKSLMDWKTLKEYILGYIGNYDEDSEVFSFWGDGENLDALTSALHNLLQEAHANGERTSHHGGTEGGEAMSENPCYLTCARFPTCSLFTTPRDKPVEAPTVPCPDYIPLYKPQEEASCE